MCSHSLEQLEMILEEKNRLRMMEANLQANIARGAAHAEKDAWQDFMDSLKADDAEDQLPTMPRPAKTKV